MTNEVTVFAAFFAGVVSFLSPCVLPLVPPYMVYLTGKSVEQLKQGEAQTGSALATAALFCLGFSTVFITLGAGASMIGAVLRAHMDTLTWVAGIAIFVMGLHFLGVFRIPFLMSQFKLETQPRSGGAGAYIMGLAFAFGWTPCIGPILAAILALAAGEATAMKGAGLLAVHSAGLAVPFLLTALALSPMLKAIQKLRINLYHLEKIMGVFLVVIALAFVSGGMASAAIWLLETFPILGTIG